MIRIPVISALLLGFSTLPAAAETPSRGIIEIAADEKTHILQVEIADEPAEQARGLMFRAALPDKSGMLFLYPKPMLTSFWMRNTPLSLDMLFIDANRRVVKIAKQTEPFSLKPIPSDQLVIGVLEIDGGSSDALGIEIGDRARWIEFPPAD